MENCEIQLEFLESSEKNQLIVILELFKEHSSDVNKCRTIFELYTSYINKDFDENDQKKFISEFLELLVLFDCVEYVDTLNIFMSEWSDYICELMESEKEKLKIYQLLDSLFETMKLIEKKTEDISMDTNKQINILNSLIQITKKLFECSCFRKVIHMFPKKSNGITYMKDGLFKSVFSIRSFVRKPDEYVDLVDALIADSSLHEFLIDYVVDIIDKNIAHTYDDSFIVNNMIMLKECSNLDFNAFMLTILFKIVDYYGLDDILKKLKEYDTEPSKIDMTDIIKYEEMSMYHKLYFGVLDGISICHITLLKNYDKLKLQNQNMSFISSIKLRNNLKNICELLYKNRNYSLNAKIQEFYLSYTEIMKKYEIQEVIYDIIVYIDYATSFAQNEKFYGYIDKKLFGFLSNVIGGYGGFITNKHMRHDACVIVVKLLKIEGIAVFDNLFENIIKYVSQINFFEWSKIFDSIEHHTKLIEIIYILTDYSTSDINVDKNIMAKFLFVLFKNATQFFSLILELCDNYKKSKKLPEDTIIFDGLTSSILTTLEIYTNMYKNNITKNVFSEVEYKYSMLIKMLLTSVTNIDENNISNFKILRRPDLEANIIRNVLKSVYEHMEIYSIHLTNIKDVLLKTLDMYSTLPKEKHNYLIEMLNKKNINVNYPEKFYDPITLDEIVDPIKIPHIEQHIFDRSSIFSTIHESGVNPYTREPLTIEMVEEYNNSENVILEIQNFLKEKKQIEEEFVTNNKNNKKNESS